MPLSGRRLTLMGAVTLVDFAFITVFFVVVIRRTILTFFRLTGCFGFGFIARKRATAAALPTDSGTWPASDETAVQTTNRQQMMR